MKFIISMRDVLILCWVLLTIMPTICYADELPKILDGIEVNETLITIPDRKYTDFIVTDKDNWIAELAFSTLANRYDNERRYVLLNSHIVHGVSSLLYQANGDRDRIVLSQINPLFYEDYDSGLYTPLGVIARQNIVLCVRNGSPYKTIGDFLQGARDAQPEDFTIASVFTSSIQNNEFFMLFQNKTGLEFWRNSYTSDDRDYAIKSLKEGRADALLCYPDEASKLWIDGVIRPLCIFGENRIKTPLDYPYENLQWDTVPTCKESGIPYVYYQETSAFVPDNLSDEQLEHYSSIFQELSKDYWWNDSLTGKGVEPIFIGPGEYRKLLENRWKENKEIYIGIRDSMRPRPLPCEVESGEPPKVRLVEMPKLFNNKKPPRASAFDELDVNLFKNDHNLKDVAARIENAFDAAGYSEKSYYSVPGGFALVSRLEQFEEDGTPAINRWSLDIENGQLSLLSILKNLFTASCGHYRVIVFIISNRPVIQDTSTSVSDDEALKWLYGGAVGLTDYLAQFPFDKDYAITALIYEFERKSVDEDPILKRPSNLTGRIHLIKSGIMEALRRQ